MNDVYKSREDDLRQCDNIFTPVPNQVGLLAFLDGTPAGLDMVSLASAYARLHPKLVRSYTLEGLLESRPDSRGAKDLAKRARTFLDEINAAEEQPFRSVGCGTDHRFRGNRLAGTALVHENEVIHGAWFRLTATEGTGQMASFSRRRRHHR